MTTAGARTAFYAFAAVMGVSMASIFLVFTGTSIALAFVSAAAVFAGMSLWGYTTNVDLSRWSTFLMVGLIGVVIASLVTLFVGSSTRSDERRVGKEVVSQCRSRWAPCH